MTVGEKQSGPGGRSSWQSSSKVYRPISNRRFGAVRRHAALG